MLVSIIIFNDIFKGRGRCNRFKNRHLYVRGSLAVATAHTYVRCNRQPNSTNIFAGLPSELLPKTSPQEVQLWGAKVPFALRGI